MGSQTYLLSDEMMNLSKQIISLNLPYMTDHRFFFRTFNVISSTPYHSVYDSYQQVSFTFVFGKELKCGAEFSLLLSSNANSILVTKTNKNDAWEDKLVSMEEFMDYITPDLAEVLYFNIDLWSKK